MKFYKLFHLWGDNLFPIRPDLFWESEQDAALCALKNGICPGEFTVLPVWGDFGWSPATGEETL